MSLERSCPGGLDSIFHCCTLWSVVLTSAEDRRAHKGPAAAVRLASLFARIFLCDAYTAALPWVHRHCQLSGNVSASKWEQNLETANSRSLV